MITKPRICVSICEQYPDLLASAIVEATTLGDLIEIRTDCFAPEERAKALESFAALTGNTERPLILTFRPAEQGGHREIDPRSRLRFWMFERPDINGFFDIELAIARNRSLFRFGKSLDWSRVICSHHNFTSLPTNLDAYLNRIFDGMKDLPARVLKIAVQVDDAVDCLSFFKLLKRAQAENRDLIAIAMGPAGIMTRVLGPSKGAFLTYAALDEGSATGPGQLTARELRDVYRIEKIHSGTAIVGLLGHPLLHSVSPNMHNAAFAATATDAVYLPFDVRDVSGFLRRMVHPKTREFEFNFKGLSVTAPHKSEVIDSLDWIEPSAREIGAVNTIVVEGDRLCGYNTDADALVTPLIQRIGGLSSRNCAIIGAGGAAAAALWRLRKEGANVTVFARDQAKARENLKSDCQALNEARFADFEIVINATPLGTAGSLVKETPVGKEQLTGAHLAYDLVYNPIETTFLSEAKAAGCETLGGLPMLIEQATSQFKLWTKVEAPRETMLAAAQAKMGN